MTPEQKQQAMQVVVDQIETLRVQRRAAMGEEAGMLANYTKAQQKTADLGTQMAIQEEILKAIEAIEPSNAKTPAPDAVDDGDPKTKTARTPGK